MGTSRTAGRLPAPPKRPLDPAEGGGPPSAARRNSKVQHLSAAPGTHSVPAPFAVPARDNKPACNRFRRDSDLDALRAVTVSCLKAELPLSVVKACLDNYVQTGAPLSYDVASAFIMKFREMHEPAEAEAMLNLMDGQRPPLPPEPRQVTSAASAWIESGQPERAVDLVCARYRKGQCPAADVAILVDKAIRRIGDADEIMACLVAAQTTIGLSARLAGTAIHALGNAGRPDLADDVHLRMVRDRIPVDTSIYNALIDAWASSPDPAKGGRWFEHMLREKCQPDARTFSCAFRSWSAAGQPDLADAWFRRMGEFGVAPDAVNYADIITVWGDADQTDKAVEWFKTIPSPPGPDQRAWHAVVCALAGSRKGRAVQARLHIDRAVKSGVPADRIWYAAIAGCMNRNDIEGALKWMHDGVVAGVFKSALGFLAERRGDGVVHTFNFHTGSIFHGEFHEHDEGVPATLARVLFEHHRRHSRFAANCEFVVGHRGQGIIRDTVEKLMADAGMRPASRPGLPGRLVATAGGTASAPLVHR
ncbi:MAG TPA: hypothetical protein VHA82_22425 [Ramlibacter sp.]|uniref:hypothetical protein n=1 Tax=Ramlibacter sp. TaxID=1917967 RepID=UPI002CB6460B|nr:hypothetical protein [Ramlibacter sp.]HVZ46578.1 hypothetical protein [Ramlibacter sp.]